MEEYQMENVWKLKRMTAHSIDELRHLGLVVPVNDTLYKSTTAGDRALQLMEKYGAKPLPSDIPELRAQACDYLNMPHDVDDWMIWLMLCLLNDAPEKDKPKPKPRVKKAKK